MLNPTREELQATFTVGSKHHGQRLDAILAELLPHYSRSQIAKWIKGSKVQVNQRPAKPKDKLKVDDRIDIAVDKPFCGIEEKNWQPENLPLDIVYEDEHLLIINKAADMVVHPAAGNYEGTIVNAMLHYFPNACTLPRAGIVHRLDKDTTGLMIIAKSAIAHQNLIIQMQERRIKRAYTALAQGYISLGGRIQTAMARHPRNRLKMAVSPSGKEAITHYHVKMHFPEFSLLDVQLETGRTHQIRVHMAHLNHPIVGDPLYGARPKLPKQATPLLKETLEGFKRQALHARSLSLTHPVRKEPISFEAALPDDFQYLLDTISAFYHDLKS